MTCTICRRFGKATKAVRFTLVNLGYCNPCADEIDRERERQNWPPVVWRAAS